MKQKFVETASVYQTLRNASRQNIKDIPPYVNANNIDQVNFKFKELMRRRSNSYPDPPRRPELYECARPYNFHNPDYYKSPRTIKRQNEVSNAGPKDPPDTPREEKPKYDSFFTRPWKKIRSGTAPANKEKLAISHRSITLLDDKRNDNVKKEKDISPARVSTSLFNMFQINTKPKIVEEKKDEKIDHAKKKISLLDKDSIKADQKEIKAKIKSITHSKKTTKRYQPEKTIQQQVDQLKADLKPQIYPRGTLLMRKSYLPIESCQKYRNQEEEWRTKNRATIGMYSKRKLEEAETKPPTTQEQPDSVVKTMKNILNDLLNIFKR